MMRKYSLGVSGFLALAGCLCAAMSGSAAAATIAIGGFTVDEADAASSLTTDSGSTEIFDKFGTGVASKSDAIGGSLVDGVRCDGQFDGCAFTVGFDFDVVNQAGDDLIIAGLGIVPEGSESFDLKIGGVTLTGFDLIDTGVLMLDTAPLKALTFDLSAFDVDVGEAITEITIIVNQGINSEEFTYVSAYYDNMVINPVPGAVWLFGSALVAGGGFLRRRKRKAS